MKKTTEPIYKVVDLHHKQREHLVEIGKAIDRAKAAAVVADDENKLAWEVVAKLLPWIRAQAESDLLGKKCDLDFVATLRWLHERGASFPDGEADWATLAASIEEHHIPF